ncbi:MAG TPA: WYL domain-containing protein [Longimicrobiales bacterium]|nr:WYL domain-containing protein [Longimicrobiales bacterium]
MRADLQLERLLYVLPAAAREEGARIEDLARALDVEPSQVLRDLEAAMTRAYYHPAGTVDPFTIMIEGDVVRVHAPREFQRPVRLNEREALALGLGLRSLAAESDSPRRAEIMALATRLESDLAAPRDLAAHGDAAAPSDAASAEVARRHSAFDDLLETDVEARKGTGVHEVEYEPDIVLAFGDDGLRGIIADAIEQHRTLRLTYLKPGDGAGTERRVAPYRLVFAEGTWYLAAHDLDRDDFRFFRLDRMLDAAIEDQPADPLPDVDLRALLQDGIAYHSRDDVQVTVRYSGTIARWIAEQRAAEQGEDGSVCVTHNVADRDWFIRHVLQYGGAATVEAPAEARRWVSAAARRLAEM